MKTQDPKCYLEFSIDNCFIFSDCANLNTSHDRALLLVTRKKKTFFFFFAVLGFEPKNSHMRSTTEPKNNHLK